LGNQSVIIVALIKDYLRGFSFSKGGTIIHQDVETVQAKKYKGLARKYPFQVQIKAPKHRKNC
jgi:hypothetical protein